jgi:hypothetical protein
MADLGDNLNEMGDKNKEIAEKWIDLFRLGINANWEVIIPDIHRGIDDPEIIKGLTVAFRSGKIHISTFRAIRDTSQIPRKLQVGLIFYNFPG